MTLEPPAKCPVCGTRDITRGVIEQLLPNDAARDATCDGCNAHWREYFTLTSLSHVSDEEGNYMGKHK